MRISEAWLREWVSPSASLIDIAAQLTQAGLEVQPIQELSYNKILVGEVMVADSHPNADRLKLCQVSDGSNNYSIVCGADNVRQGLKVALALPGAVLPNGTKIAKAKIRGEPSEGMLCSGDELALEGEWQGILELSSEAKPGDDLVDHLPQVMDIAIMPNRGDCLSVRGIAREVAVLNQLPLEPPPIKAIQPQHNDIVKVDLVDPEGCPLYMGRIIKDLDINRPSPPWMQDKLTSCGMRSIDAIVDITNYVMLELGQPLHAFDLTQIQGGIKVRSAKNKEKLVLLDGRQIELDPSDLLIADHNKPLALAGVMGGENSGINKDTKDVFLEGAFFTPHRIQGKQRKFNFVTEAAYRFERGVDYDMTALAMERATSLLVDILGGKPGPLHKAVVDKHLPTREPLAVSYQQLNQFLGFTVPPADIQRILAALGMEYKQLDKDQFSVLPPSFRFDMDCWQAVAEEVARIYGYDAVPSHLPAMPLEPRLLLSANVKQDGLRDRLIARGYQEVISYSFISNKEYTLTTQADHQPLKLANPISAEMVAMRSNLLAGLMNALSHNYRQFVDKQKLFEIGMCFVPVGSDYQQETHVAGLIHQGEKLYGEGNYSFSSAKGDVQMLLSSLSTKQDEYFIFDRHSTIYYTTFLHPVESIVWGHKRDEQPFCYCGMVHPTISQKFRLTQGSVYYFAINLDRLNTEASKTYKPFSRYPSAHRELSLVMDEAMTYADLKAFIFSHGGASLRKIELLDIYRAAELGNKKKSLSLRLVWQSDQATLTDEQLTKLVDKLLDKLAKEKNILLREG